MPHALHVDHPRDDPDEEQRTEQLGDRQRAEDGHVRGAGQVDEQRWQRGIRGQADVVDQVQRPQSIERLAREADQEHHTDGGDQQRAPSDGADPGDRRVAHVAPGAALTGRSGALARLAHGEQHPAGQHEMCHAADEER